MRTTCGAATRLVHTRATSSEYVLYCMEKQMPNKTYLKHIHTESLLLVALQGDPLVFLFSIQYGTKQQSVDCAAHAANMRSAQHCATSQWPAFGIQRGQA